jgi:chorismate mutase
MDSKYLVIDKKVLPDIFEKVIRVKHLLKTGKSKEITEAVKIVGISRSTYYKYKDYVFTLSEGSIGRKITIAFLLDHEKGILSNILNNIANLQGNVLTINQGIPINDIANVTITLDITNLTIDVEDLLQTIKELQGVVNIDLIAME